MRILLLLACMCSVAQAQTIRFHTDSSRNTTDVLAGSFIVRMGMGGHKFELQPNRDLSFAIISDMPGFSNEKVVGRWEASGDSMSLDIKKRLDGSAAKPKSGKFAPYSRKFRIVKLCWTLRTQEPDRFLNPLVYEMNVIALVEKKDLAPEELVSGLMQWLEAKYQGGPVSDGFDFISAMGAVQGLVEQYFHEQKIFTRCRTYSNGNRIGY